MLPANLAGVGGQTAVLLLPEGREHGGVSALELVALPAPEGQFCLTVKRHQPAYLLAVERASLHRVAELLRRVILLHK